MSNRKLVVITGASSGIGKALAIKFSKEGYPLLLLARRVSLIQDLKLPNCIAKSVDVRDFDAFQKAIKEAEKKFGAVDLLINNAGIMPMDQYADQKLSDKYDMIDINLKGVVNGMDTVLPEMKKNKTGTIVNISSVAGRYTYDSHAVYNATKYGVHALSEAVRREIAGSNVRILVFAPAIVDTNLLDSTTNKEILSNYKAGKEKINGGLTAEQSADVIFYMYSLPQSVAIKELIISHTDQAV